MSKYYGFCKPYGSVRNELKDFDTHLTELATLEQTIIFTQNNLGRNPVILKQIRPEVIEDKNE